MRTLYIAAAAAIGFALLVAGVFAYGVHVGATREIATQAKTDRAVAADREAQAQVIAKAVANIRVVTQTTKQVLEREIRIVPDYSACHHSADGLRAVNSALTNQPVPAGDSSVPPTNPTP